MKRFLDYQLKNQVQIPNNPYTVRNFEKIRPYLEQIKSQYLQGKFKKVTHYSYTPSSKFLQNLSRDYLMPIEQVNDMFCDPEYGPLSQNAAIDSFVLDDPEYRQIERKIRVLMCGEFGLDRDTMQFQIHIQKPGQYFPLHIDYVRTNLNGSPDITMDPKHTKFLIFFDDWEEGQVFQINRDFLKWRSCDMINYNIRDCQHGSANFGYYDRYLMLVTAKYL
jgi:hypothetical protein